MQNGNALKCKTKSRHVLNATGAKRKRKGNATGTKRKRKGDATETRPERKGNEAGMHIFLMYMARQDPRRNRKERRTERRMEISEKNEEGRGTRKKDWHGPIEEDERGGRRKTEKKIVA